MPERPRRRYEVEIQAGADNKFYLIGLLKEVLHLLDSTPDEQPYAGVSGGGSGRYGFRLDFYPTETHDTYAEKLETYLVEFDNSPTPASE